MDDPNRDSPDRIRAELLGRVRFEGPSSGLLEEAARWVARLGRDDEEMEVLFGWMPLAPVAELAGRDPEDVFLGRVLSRIIRRERPKLASVVWKDRQGVRWFEYPEAELTFRVDEGKDSKSPPPPEEALPGGLARWKVTGTPFRAQRMGYRMGQARYQEVPERFLEHLRKPGVEISFSPVVQAWSVHASYFEDRPYSNPHFSFDLSFRPSTGLVEYHSVADYE